jgi:hypothetical protein
MTINGPSRGKVHSLNFYNSIPALKDRAIDSFSIQSAYLN